MEFISIGQIFLFSETFFQNIVNGRFLSDWYWNIDSLIFKSSYCASTKEWHFKVILVPIKFKFDWHHILFFLCYEGFCHYSIICEVSSSFCHCFLFSVSNKESGFLSRQKVSEMKNLQPTRSFDIWQSLTVVSII